ncbi:hypothetical protein QAD02_013871 [Eretmocerus hayati]|uniref:Uncharacterized protein n=1 Tax=Eretmocerus hayati TaxID=131215 RepID=A0ACC2P3C3_9HYME|nr:hypothetical protein QAD02_013871 [Eretmocerus hayati]
MPHAGWTSGQGYTRIYNSSGTKVVQAQCNECKTFLTRRDLEALMAHTNRHQKERLLRDSIANGQNSTGQAPVSSRSVQKAPSPRQQSSHKLSHQVSDECVSNEPPKKRSSLENLGTKKSLCTPAAKLNELLLKLLFAFERKFNDVENVHLKAFVKALSPSYCLPSPEDLETSILCDAAGMIITENIEEEKTHTLWVQRLKVEKKYILISAVIGNCKYIYIDFLVTSDLLQKDFEDFCQESCKQSSDLYDNKIYSIIHNTEFNCENLKIGDGRVAFVSKSFSLILDKLEKEVSFSVDYTVKDDVDKYYKELRMLKTELKNNGSVAEGTMNLKNFLEAQPEHISKEISDSITTFFQPLHYAALLLHPLYRTSVLEDNYIKSRAFKYLTNIIKELTRLSDINHYMAGVEGFQHILNELDDLTVEDFWRNAHCSYPQLSNIAFSLLRIPAIPKLLDEEKLTVLAQTDYDELDQDSVLMMLTVQLEQL